MVAAAIPDVKIIFECETGKFPSPLEEEGCKAETIPSAQMQVRGFGKTHRKYHHANTPCTNHLGSAVSRS